MKTTMGTEIENLFSGIDSYSIIEHIFFWGSPFCYIAKEIVFTFGTDITDNFGSEINCLEIPKLAFFVRRYHNNYVHSWLLHNYLVAWLECIIWYKFGWIQGDSDVFIQLFFCKSDFKCIVILSVHFNLHSFRICFLSKLAQFSVN